MLSRFLLSLALLATLSAPNQAPTTFAPAEHPSVYLLETEDGRCTAWAVEEHLVFTAAHCVPPHTKPAEHVGVVLAGGVWAGATLIDVGKEDFIHDWALLRVSGVDLTPLQIEPSYPGPSEKLRAFGYAGETELTAADCYTLSPQIVFGSIVAFFAYDARPGDSGGPVLNSRGKAVSLIFGGNRTLQITLGVPGSVLADVLDKH